MKQGFLSDFFDGFAVKILSLVEANPDSSNQHEFNGVSKLKKIFGDTKQTVEARFLWIGAENDSISSEGFLTWYDAREKHPTRSEYRLYFPSNAVTHLSSEGDALFIARRSNGAALVIVTPIDTEIYGSLLWLFSLQDLQDNFVFTVPVDPPPGLEFTVRYILDEIGIEVDDPESDELDQILDKFQGKFPTTREFSQFTRESINDADPLREPDATLLAWMNKEELLFKRLERHIVAERLSSGFMEDGDADVDGFIKFSLSVQNRRKSRVGHALENHLESIFHANRVQYTRGAVTENKSKPDFLFPGKDEYHNPAFSAELLTMLAAKSSCKDRWRQVLPEAARINNKHLLTLQPAISSAQTDEMHAHQLQLVLPVALHDTYTANQRGWLISLQEFLTTVENKYSKSVNQ